MLCCASCRCPPPSARSYAPLHLQCIPFPRRRRCRAPSTAPLLARRTRRTRRRRRQRMRTACLQRWRAMGRPRRPRRRRRRLQPRPSPLRRTRRRRTRRRPLTSAARLQVRGGWQAGRAVADERFGAQGCWPACGRVGHADAPSLPSGVAGCCRRCFALRLPAYSTQMPPHWLPSVPCSPVHGR